MKKTLSKIIQHDHAVLRTIADEVPLSDIGTPKLQAILSDMKVALKGEEDGVALAAPQIGVALQIFIVSKKIMEILGEKVRNDLVFINPKITKTSKERVYMEEGCLSVRYLYGKVKRAKKTTIEAYDEHGKKFQRGASGLLSQIFQHETDHLKGILFIDSAKDLEELPPQK